MNEILSFLKFTLEIGDDFADGKLPSLDTTVWVEWKTSQEEDTNTKEDVEQESQQHEDHSQEGSGKDSPSSHLEENGQEGKKSGWPVIMFEHYEKPMSSNLVVQARSALSEETKISTLAEECDQTEEKLSEAWRPWIPATICRKFLEKE